MNLNVEEVASTFVEKFRDILSAIDESISTCGSVHEHALWETYKDFLNPEINPAALANVVPIIQ